jgi:hypothetical protein
VASLADRLRDAIADTITSLELQADTIVAAATGVAINLS